MITIKDITAVCIEDDNFAREEMLHFLKKRVHHVYGAPDGIEGLKYIENYRPEIAIIDLLMPRMDGVSVIKKLRKENSNVHIIVVTSVNSLDTVLELVDLGIDSYIVKPLDFAELELKMVKIVDQINIEHGNSQNGFGTIEDKYIIEDKIKSGFAKLIKEFTGKGPREAVVQLQCKEIKVTIFGAMTVVERNLLKSVRNYEAIRQFRNTMYEAISPQAETLIMNILNCKVTAGKIAIDPKKEIDQIVFHLN